MLFDGIIDAFKFRKKNKDIKKNKNVNLNIRDIAINNAKKFNNKKLLLEDIDGDYEFEIIYKDLYTNYGNNELIVSLLESFKYAYDNYNKDGVLYNMECLSYLLKQCGMKIKKGNGLYDPNSNILYFDEDDYHTMWHELGHAIHFMILNHDIPDDFKEKVMAFVEKNKDSIIKIVNDLCEISKLDTIESEESANLRASLYLISDFISGAFVCFKDDNDFYLKFSIFHYADYYANHDYDNFSYSYESFFEELMANFNAMLITYGKKIPELVQKILGDELTKDIEKTFLKKADSKYNFENSDETITKKMDILDRDKAKEIFSKSAEKRQEELSIMGEDFYKDLLIKFGDYANDILVDYLYGDIESLMEEFEKYDCLYILEKMAKYSREELVTLYASVREMPKYFSAFNKYNTYKADNILPITRGIRNIEDNQQFYYLLKYYITGKTDNEYLKEVDDLTLLDYLLDESKRNDEQRELLKEAINKKISQLSEKEKKKLKLVNVDMPKSFIYSIERQYENCNCYIDHYGIIYFINSSIDVNDEKVSHLVEKIHQQIEENGLENNNIKFTFVIKNQTVIEEVYEETQYNNFLVVKYNNSSEEIDALVERKIGGPIEDAKEIIKK